MRSWLCGFLLFLSCLLCTFAGAQSNLQFDTVLFPIISKYQTDYTGIAIGMVKNGKVVYQRGFGYADKKNKLPCTDTGIMEVASISKAMVGLAIAKAIELGYCHLDSPVNTMLPFPIVNPYAPHQQITLRQIVTHTSGIHDAPRFFWKTFQYSDYKDPDKSLVNFVKLFVSPGGKCYSKHNFHKAAMDRFPLDYSNLNAAIGALVVEHVSKMNFTAFMQTYIFEKASMMQTGWLFSQLEGQTLAQKYTSPGLKLRHYTIRSYPSSTLYTSVGDMNKLFMALAHPNNNGLFSSPQTLALLFNEKHPNDDYGIFWRRYGTSYGCTGINLGIEAVARYNPTTKSGYILIFNQTLKGKQNWVYRELTHYLDSQLVSSSISID